MMYKVTVAFVHSKFDSVKVYPTGDHQYLMKPLNFESENEAHTFLASKQQSPNTEEPDEDDKCLDKFDTNAMTTADVATDERWRVS
ncbi:unnamed protein product [Didymodactylos carnosus]|uniref:Uncharacterized protein n=1 Tax=Didymodactylos carnosus TaxID=1234261 RepID=A0A814L3C8_9BILA|nr:unnamed protein product [Didymodactylos carnosus]CAF1396574.1 unnamed protein product [Didymodactylos carnosus]CAF3826749.1 unnamed protein product [Didymodactylos carnosus]CAF4204013.1 unnamed protein product [Didymodactylos carnosus]